MTGAAAAPPPFSGVIEALTRSNGWPKALPLSDPWELILWENVAYFVDDRRRALALGLLRDLIGTDPASILSAPPELLLQVTRTGIVSEQQADKLRTAASIALEEPDGALQSVCRLPIAKAKKLLRRFPGIGEPGAEKILLFSHAYPLFALESNGLRVLLRLGYGEESDNYGASYRSVQRELQGELQEDCDWLIGVHCLLRAHGQDVCRRSQPECGVCPLAADCAFRRREPGGLIETKGY